MDVNSRYACCVGNHRLLALFNSSLTGFGNTPRQAQQVSRYVSSPKDAGHTVADPMTSESAEIGLLLSATVLHRVVIELYITVPVSRLIMNRVTMASILP